MKYKAALFATLAALGLLSAAQAQQEIKLTVSAGHPPIFLWVKHLKETFIPAVDAELAKQGKYKIVWTEAYAGTLAKLGSELQTIEQGVSDMGVVLTVFQSTQMPLQNVSYFTPFGPTDPALVCSVMDELQQKLPVLKEQWTKHNLEYLAGTGICLEDYDLVANFPLTKVDDLKGHKIGGAGPNLTWIRGSGAVGVVGNLGSFYNDIKAGLYDGAIIFATAAVPSKLFEVGQYYNDVSFGAPYAGGLAVNKQRWDKLPPDVQTAFRKAAGDYRAAFGKEQKARIDEAMATWREKGKVVDFPAAEREKLAHAIQSPTADWVAGARKLNLPAQEVLKAYMDAVRARGVKFARDWDKD